MNSVYLGHGVPLNAIWNTDYHRNLVQFTKNQALPKAIVVVSAHFERHIPLQITSTKTPSIIYDYYGFPEEMYQLQYNCPGSPEIAGEIAQLLTKTGRKPILNPKQGLDHGAWIPLKIMYPKADIPILQLSIPVPRDPLELYQIGQVLAPLRDKGIMFMGSGNLIHNLQHTFSQLIKYGKGIDGFRTMPVESWAVDADNWLKEHLDERNTDFILQASERLENFKAVAPTTEHFDPLYFILGTMAPSEGISYIHEGFEGGSISMRSFVSEI